MTALSVAQDAAREVGLQVQNALVNSTLPDVRRLLRTLNRVGTQIARDGQWQNLRREHVFTTTNAEAQAGALPTDFGRMVPSTLQNRTSKLPILGPIGAEQWQRWKSRTSTNNAYYFTLRGDDLLLWDVPPAGDTVAFEYWTDQWCESSGGSGQTSILADTDALRLPEELLTLGVIAVYLSSQGDARAPAAMREYKMALAQYAANDKPGSGMLGSGAIHQHTGYGSFDIYSGSWPY